MLLRFVARLLVELAHRMYMQQEEWGRAPCHYCFTVFVGSMRREIEGGASPP